MKLEEGKWYKWFHTSHATYHIGKYYNNPDEGFVKMKPWLDSSKQYEIAGIFESKFMQDIVEITDLTEIQKLLPDGHEDKVDKIAKPKFIVGKWYKNLNYGKNWIAKAISDSRMSEYNFYHGDYITDSKVFREQSVSISSLRWNKDTVECRLSEIQEYLPDGHVDKIGSSSKRYTATMKFFNELKEPERSEAIDNYDDNYDDNCNENCNENCVPSTLNEALVFGFGWGDSAQGHAYWDNLYSSINNNIYFKEPETEVLVFGKYKVGDVVVSLTTNGSSRKEGDLFTVREDSTQHKLCYATYYGSIQPNDWRLATPEEVSEYNKGIKNINDIKQEAVNCTTQEEWDFVLSKFNPRGLTTDNFSKNSDNKCIITASSNSEYVGCYSSENYIIVMNYTILTFKEWCDKYEYIYVKEEAILDKLPDKPSEVDISYRVDKIGNFYIDDICVSNCMLYPLTPKEVYTNYSIPKPTTITLKTKSKSIKL